MTEAEKICVFANVPYGLAALVVSKARQHCVKLKELRSESRMRYLVECRRDISKTGKELGYSYPEIGRALNRDHTSIMHLVSGDFYFSSHKSVDGFPICSSERDRIAA